MDKEKTQQKELINPRTGEQIKTDLFSIRLKPDEQERYEEMVRRALDRNPAVLLSDINRELLGLKDWGLFSQEDLAYFRGRPETPFLKANVPKTSSRPKEAKTDAAASKKRKTN
jgi:hypothetical protein